MASTDSPENIDCIQPAAAEVIADSDILARQIVYPNAFEGNVIGANALLQFMGNRNSDGSFTESLMLERLTTAEAIHIHGCQAARTKNDKQKLNREAAGKTPSEPISGEDRRYYCGYTRAPAKPLYLKTSRYFIELAVEEEGGEKAHVTIALRPTDITNKLKPNDKTEAGRLLALKFADPQSHICPEDQSDICHPINRWGSQVLVMNSAA